MDIKISIIDICYANTAPIPKTSEFECCKIKLRKISFFGKMYRGRQIFQLDMYVILTQGSVVITTVKPSLCSCPSPCL